MKIRYQKLINFYGITTLATCCMMTVAYADSTSRYQELDKYALPLTATAIPLNHKDTSLTSVGKLHYMGGLKITSSKRYFGGISSFVVSPEGDQILGISDRGLWLIADLVYGQNNHLADIENARMAPLKQLSGKIKPARDAEALTAVDGAGYVVSFESPHTLRYFQATHAYNYDSLFFASAQKVTFAPILPNSFASLPKNLGIEALTTLPDGRMLAFSENTLTKKDKTFSQGWLIGHGKVEKLGFEVSPSYRPTDMATLPNGDILVLERHFSLAKGMAARLTRISAKLINTDKIIKGEVIADLAYPFNLDNMEALAVRENAKGEIIIYIMSDNNYNRLQRNILMMFKLDEGIKKAAEQKSGFGNSLADKN